MDLLWKKILADYSNNGIELEKLTEKNGDIFYLQNVYLVFIHTYPLFLTSDLKLIDISNHNFSFNKAPFMQVFRYDLAMNCILNAIKNIKANNFEYVSEKCLSILAHQPFFPIHNMEDKLNAIEIFIKNYLKTAPAEKKNDAKLIHLLALNTQDSYYNDFLTDIENVYRDFPFVIKKMNAAKVYKISEFYIAKIYHNFIYNTFSEDTFIHYLNRKKIYNKSVETANNIDQSSGSVCVKIDSMKNGTKGYNRCVHFDFESETIQNKGDINNLNTCCPHTFFGRYNFIYLNDMPTHIKDYMIMNSNLCVLSYGSNFYVNMKLLNYHSGKMFIVFCSSAYYRV